MDNLTTFKLPGQGLRCGHCDAVLPKVTRTRQTAGLVMRERTCPECGRVNTTCERVLNTHSVREYRRGPGPLD